MTTTLGNAFRLERNPRTRPDDYRADPGGRLVPGQCVKLYFRTEGVPGMKCEVMTVRVTEGSGRVMKGVALLGDSPIWAKLIDPAKLKAGTIVGFTWKCVFGVSDSEAFEEPPTLPAPPRAKKGGQAATARRGPKFEPSSN